MPDAATAGVLSPTLSVDRVLAGVDAVVLLVAIVLEYTSWVWSVFRKLHAKLEVRRVVRVWLEVGSVRARLL